MIVVSGTGRAGASVVAGGGVVLCGGGAADWGDNANVGLGCFVRTIR